MHLAITCFNRILTAHTSAHKYLVAAQANSTTDFPVPSPCKGSMATPKAQWVTDLRQYGKNPKYVTACQTYPTVIVNELQKKGKASLASMFTAS